MVFVFFLLFITYIHAQEHWFTQNLDHFNFAERRTWQQRYFLNQSFFNPDLGGPIFIEIGGEGSISPAYVTKFMLSKYAQQEGALQVALEHRFYGTSNPLPSLSTANLQYLNSKQALADLSTFLAFIKSKYPTATDVISFGGSYPGALASWFRQKYPHVTLGAVASSGPVLAVLDMTTYLDVVEQSIDKLSGLECEEKIQDATNIIQSLLQSAAGRQQLTKRFNLCTPLTTDWKDIATLMSSLMGNWMGTVQYNKENPKVATVRDLCEIMLQKYSTQVAQLSNTSIPGPGVGDRSWTWQTCQEFGYFQSTDSPNQPFGNLVPLKYYIQLCADVFGTNNAVPRIAETNIHYGGRSPGSSNVLFVNGNIDPWHSLSILKSNPQNPAIVIDGTAHCADMRPATPNDPPSLAIAQQKIGDIIHSWLTQKK